MLLRTRLREVLFLGAALGGIASVLGPPPLSAQQYVVDDAAIVDRGACQAEAWHGERSSWILPACQFVRNLELAVGVGFVDIGGGRREVEQALEAKTLFRPIEPNDWGVGLVVGIGPNPSAAPEDRVLGDVYAFVPGSVSFRDDRLSLHGNLGWGWDREDGDHGHTHHHLTWGVRGDGGISPSFTLIGEVFGEDRLRPEYQAGVRLHLPDAGVEVDLSWGGRMQSDRRGAGFTIGAQFVSGRIF